MSPIKVILIILLLLVLRAFLIQKSLVLIKRIIAFLMFFALLFLILFPDVSTHVANVIGVGRGVDLIFYFSHLFLLLLIVALWRRSAVLMVTITRLSRAIAIQSANKPQEKKEKPNEQNNL